jgi:RNA polymerase sigma-70 factor (ECF subfamily)
MALWNRAELFDPQQGSLLAWLSTIARNRAVDRLRQLGRRPAAMPLSAVLSDDDHHDDRSTERVLANAQPLASGSASIDPVALFDDAALADEIKGALDTIPGPERQVLELAYYEELTQTEIATRLGWPLGTVKTRTRRALYRLRGVLTDLLGTEIAPRSRADRSAILQQPDPGAEAAHAQTTARTVAEPATELHRERRRDARHEAFDGPR